MHNRQIRSLKSTIWVWGLGINFNSSAQIVNIQDWFSSNKYDWQVARIDTQGNITFE
jgi:hypothetical protein